MRSIILLLFFSFSAMVFASQQSEAKTAEYFASIQNNQTKLASFLDKLPKGGELHIHASGASWAENMLQYAAHDRFCIERNTDVVFFNHCQLKDLLKIAIENPTFYNKLIDSWSMRHFDFNKQGGHDHFFSAFAKFDLIAKAHTGEILTEIVKRAARQNQSYLELMVTPDDNASGLLGKKIGWNADLNKMRDELLKNDIEKIVTSITENLNRDEKYLRATLACNNKQKSQSGCKVNLRYLYTTLREQAPEMVFGQLLAGFLAAKNDPRIVGINLVMPEDGTIALRDYQLHMQMLNFLHKLYPTVHISLHAGEINGLLVKPNELKSHIHDAIFNGDAERIGHGVDIAGETNSTDLLKYMANHHILAEINLSSNADILGVSGNAHPLPLYLKYNVPVALSTDDEGIIRTDITNEFKRAINTYHFSYLQLKEMIRNSLEYSFLAGKSLWVNHDYQHMVSICKPDALLNLKGPVISKSCQAFLAANDKAKMQWKLEKQFSTFEKTFG